MASKTVTLIETITPGIVLKTQKRYKKLSIDDIYSRLKLFFKHYPIKNFVNNDSSSPFDSLDFDLLEKKWFSFLNNYKEFEEWYKEKYLSIWKDGFPQKTDKEMLEDAWNAALLSQLKKTKNKMFKIKHSPKELEKQLRQVISEKRKLEGRIIRLKSDIYSAKLQPFKKAGYKYHLCNENSPNNSVGGKMAKGWTKDIEASNALGSPVTVMRIHRNKKERVLK